jgi:opacity protein-like surface antigen
VNQVQFVNAAKAAVFAIGAFIGMSQANAQTSPESPQLYVGGTLLSSARYDLQCTTGINCDRSSSGGAGKIFAGGFIVPNTIGIEASLFGTGKAKGAYTRGSITAPAEFHSRGLALTGVYRINSGDFALDTRLGMAYIRSETRGVGASSLPTETKNSVAPTVGLGARYAINKEWQLNLDWDWFRPKFANGKSVNTDMFTAGVTYNFR